MAIESNNTRPGKPAVARARGARDGRSDHRAEDVVTSDQPNVTNSMAGAGGAAAAEAAGMRNGAAAATGRASGRPEPGPWPPGAGTDRPALGRRCRLRTHLGLEGGRLGGEAHGLEAGRLRGGRGLEGRRRHPLRQDVRRAAGLGGRMMGRRLTLQRELRAGRCRRRDVAGMLLRVQDLCGMACGGGRRR